MCRDKNASSRTPQVTLPSKAKVGLRSQPSREAFARQGLLTLDSPTVHGIGVLMFSQIMVNLLWTSTWREEDVAAVFLQGVL